MSLSPFQLGKWLFDPCRPYALPFDTDAAKRHSLNLCVRAMDSDDISYKGVVQIKNRLPGVHIIPSANLLSKRQMGTSSEAKPKQPRLS